MAEDLTIATAFSGTDSPLVLAIGDDLFSCDFDNLKWILDNFLERKRLFSDIKTLKRNEVFNIVTRGKKRVPSADIFITGFVCKSVFTENNDPKMTYKNCIGAATLSVMMSYVRKHRPTVVIAEKVKGITQRIDGEDLINQVADAMNAGYHFAYRLLNTSHFIPKAVIAAGCWVSVFMNASANVRLRSLTSN